jgi:hypothetical protein
MRASIAGQSVRRTDRLRRALRPPRTHLWCEEPGRLNARHDFVRNFHENPHYRTTGEFPDYWRRLRSASSQAVSAW